MEYVLVLVGALVVGGLVYWVSLRGPDEGVPAAPAGGFSHPTQGEPAPPAPPGITYIPVTTARRTWETRVSGIVGLLITILLTAAAIGITIYLVGTEIARLLSHVAGNGGVKHPL